MNIIKPNAALQLAVYEALVRTKSRIEGHFVLKNADAFKKKDKPTPSGKGDHSDTYLDKDRISKFPSELNRLAMLLAVMIFNEDINIDAIACPAVGAIKFTEALARHLSVLLMKDIITVYAEDLGGKKTLKRSDFAHAVKGKDVLATEDIWTTGGSLAETIDAIKNAGGNPIAAAVMIVRGDLQKADIGVDTLFVMYEVEDIEKWPVDECPLCKKGTSVKTDLGKGRQFLEL
jgi:orotate phosphoribosyltransferase